MPAGTVPDRIDAITVESGEISASLNPSDEGNGVALIAPTGLSHEAAKYTGTQTSTVLITAGASDILEVTHLQIQAGATTAGEVVIYFGTGAYSRGTSAALFDGEFAPSSTSKPGIFVSGPFRATAVDQDLRVTTSAAITITVSVWYRVDA